MSRLQESCGRDTVVEVGYCSDAFDCILRSSLSPSATFYNPNTGNQGACGGFIGTNDWVVALNTDQYAGGETNTRIV